MNNIVSNFAQILDFAKSYALPLSKKRAILREYLQVKILDFIYQNKVSLNLFFVGGTSLRLLYNLNRFSEDLDFDAVKTKQSQIKKLMENTHQKLLKENIAVDFYQNITSKRAYYEFRFKDLLYELRLSGNREEKLMIKLDFETFWQGQERKTLLLNRYGFLANIITLPLDQILTQKLFAYTRRKQTLPRDIYDIVWLIAHQAKLDKNLVKKNRLPRDLAFQAINKFQRERRKLKNFKLRLKPFLVNENEAEKLVLLPQVLNRGT